MKHNRHYKPPKAAKKRAERNPKKKSAKKKATKKKSAKKKATKKSKKPSTTVREALEAMDPEKGIFWDMTYDARKKDSDDPAADYELVSLRDVEIIDDSPYTFMLVDRSALKSNPRRRNAAAKKKPKPKREKTALDLEAENTQKILEDLAEESDQVLARVAVQNISGKVVMPFPTDPKVAYVTGIFQGIEAVKKLCPTYSIPGISLINKDAANILQTIKARKMAEREGMLEMAKRVTGVVDPEGFRSGFTDYTFTQEYEDIDAGDAISEQLQSLEGNVPDEPALAWQLGFNLGMRFGLDACPMKWIPFVPAFRKIKAKLKQFDDRLALEQAKQIDRIAQESLLQERLEETRRAVAGEKASIRRAQTGKSYRRR